MRFLVVVALALGCKSGDAPRATPGSGSATASSTAGSASASGTAAPTGPDAAIHTFAASLAAEAPTCDPAALAARIDQPDAATAARIICEWWRGVASYKLIRIRTIDGKQRPIMRRLLVHPQSKALLVNYDQLELRTATDGSLRLADLFAYRQGVWVSQLTAANASLTSGVDLLPADAPPGVRAARDAIRADRRTDAIRMIDELPADLRASRTVQLLRVQATIGRSGESHRESLRILTSAYPNDPTIALTAIDRYLDLENYDAALTWLDIMEKEIGPDAFLDYQRAFAYLQKRDLANARTRIDAALASEPTLTKAVELRLEIAIEQKAWPDVLAIMRELETKHGIRFDDAELRSEPRLTELLALPEAQKWLAERGTAP